MIGKVLVYETSFGIKVTLMIDILLGPGVFKYSLPAPPSKRWAVEQLRYDLNKVILYRRGLSARLPSDHLLVRLIQSLNIDLTLPDQEYVWAVEDEALRLSNAFRLTSPWGHGHPFSPGYFYSPYVNEIIFASLDAFDVELCSRNWEDINPIRVITHPYNGLTLPILNGEGAGLGRYQGWASIVINIPLLALQHKRWWEVNCRYNTDSPPPINLFFGRYPLANLLANHLDITLLNRTMALDQDTVLQDLSNPNPFYIGMQAAGQTDRMIKQSLTFMQRPNMTFDEWLDAVPQATVDNVHEWLVLPTQTFITQVEWAFFITRMTLMAWLLKRNKEMESGFNNEYITNIRHWVQRMESGKFFHQGLRTPQLLQVQAFIKDNIDPYIRSPLVS